MMIGFPGKWPGSAPERAAQCSAWCSSTTMPCASWSTFDAPTRVKAVMDSRIRPSKQYLRSITTTATISAMYFNPRSPCGERRVMPLGCDYFCYFNPRSPCGERPKPTGRRWPHSNFNPRSPCGERRLCGVTRAHYIKFQSTLPVRGATAKMPKRNHVGLYSHACRPCVERRECRR